MAPTFTGTFGSSDLLARGAEVDIMVGIGRDLMNALRVGGGTPPSPVRVKAMIDTGLSQTMIRLDKLAPLCVPSVGKAQMLSAAANATDPPPEFDGYDVSIATHGGTIVVPSMIVIGAPLTGHTFEGLIGRDLLAHGVFVYVGSAGYFTLAF